MKKQVISLHTMNSELNACKKTYCGILRGEAISKAPLVSHQTGNQSLCLQAQTLLCVCIILVWALDMFFT